MTVGFSKMLQTEALPVKSLFPIRTMLRSFPRAFSLWFSSFVTAFSQRLRDLGTCCITDALIPMTLENLDHHCSSYIALKSTNYTDSLVTDTNDMWCFSQEDWAVSVRKAPEEDPHTYLHPFWTGKKAFEFHEWAISSQKALSLTVHNGCSPNTAHWFGQKGAWNRSAFKPRHSIRSE